MTVILETDIDENLTVQVHETGDVTIICTYSKQKITLDGDAAVAISKFIYHTDKLGMLNHYSDDADA